MTKPLPTGSIKDNPDLSWRTFNFLIESVSLEDKKGHLYIVDIEFNYKNASKKQIICNEIYPPIVEKQKTIDPNEKSVYQLLDNFREGKDDPRIENFVSGSLIEEYVNNTFNDKFHKLNKNDPFYDIKLSTLKQEQNEGLESAKKFSEKKKKLKRKNTIVDYFDRIEEAQQNTNIKSLIEFDYSHSNSIKAVIAKQNTNIKPTTRFLSGKMLMFAKISIKSFVCDIIDVFMFPDETIQSIYRKFNIEKCFLYQCLTDTDSTSLNFIFICNLNCVVDEINSRKIIFEVLISSKLIDRLDLSDDFWSDFNVQNKKLKKQVGLFEIESINSPNIITIAINPKEYREEFDNLSNNKKHKGIKKGTPGMDFDAYFSKLYNITDYFESILKIKKNLKKFCRNDFKLLTT